MHLHNYFFTFIVVILVSNFANCAEYVPAYMWGTNKFPDRVSALHKNSQDSFKDALLEYSRNKPYIVVFAEQTLSPEDFAQRDQNGDTPYQKLSKLRQANKVSYQPYVQDPIGAVKNLDGPITELSIETLITNLDVPKDNILIIDLNDARDGEGRIHMLQRHDSDIVDIYNDLAKKHDDILAIYTAHHASWVEPEETVVRKARSLLAAPEVPTPGVHNQTGLLLYFNNTESVYSANGTSYINGSDLISTAPVVKDNKVSFSLGNADKTKSILFDLSFDTSGYWYLDNITVEVKSANIKDVITPRLAFAPLGFSYHCGAKFYSNINGTLDLNSFQIQLINSTTLHLQRFGDAYDCVGFTSTPIWSGLFVTFILLSIITFGLTMMMDIKTMDRFDDAKGKTITINVAE